MRFARWLALACAIAGCRQLAGLDDPLPDPTGDAGTDDGGPDIDAPPGGCFGTATVEVCFAAPPTGDVVLSAPIDTDTSPLCATNVVSGGSGFCVIAGASISLPSGTVRASGMKPLVLAATTISINGTIDIASHRGGNRGAGADAPGCAAGNPPSDSGGGAGGSFGGVGGAGGSPNGGSPAGVFAATSLHGGCAGAEGAGGNAGDPGDGGGAIALVATQSIDIGGAINASGAGAKETSDSGVQGGSGGGSGGMVVLDAPTVTVGGLVFANGGGGGEGADNANAGRAGNDPTNGGVASGGAGNTTGGDGGNGSGGASLAGSAGAPGTAGTSGGGGGGGGAGVIQLFGTRQGGGTLSPPPS